MTSTDAALRPTRRHARLRCQMRLGEHAFTAFSANVSSSGIYLRVPKAMLEGHPIGPSRRARLDLSLHAARPPLQANAEVVWTNPLDADAAGAPMFGLGMRLLEISSRDQRRLDRFVREFRYTIMLVANDDKLLERLRNAFSNYRVLTCRSTAEALSALRRQSQVNALISDDSVAPQGLASLCSLVCQLPEHGHLSRVALTTAQRASELKSLVESGGVFHCLRKPFEIEDLRQVVRRAVDAQVLSSENERLQVQLADANRTLRRIEEADGFSGDTDKDKALLDANCGSRTIVGESAAIQRALTELGRIGASEVTVHIQGETGTGKELFAKALHRDSPRHGGPFVAQNCGGIAENLLHSTLFGHLKGAFTGADRDHEGVFQQADGGTLFLDEVAELSAGMQAALLRALQEGEIVPLGATRPLHVDVRVVSATHKDLRREAKKGQFRQDLYYRLVVIAFQLPPLRERQGDISLLAKHFFNLHCKRHRKRLLGFSADTLRILERYHWPGNVRELENEVQRMIVLSPQESILEAHLVSPHVRNPSVLSTDLERALVAADATPMAGKSYDEAVDDLERSMVSWALAQSDGVVSRAAELLRMDRSRLSKLRRRLGLAEDRKASKE